MRFLCGAITLARSGAGLVNARPVAMAYFQTSPQRWRTLRIFSVASLCSSRDNTLINSIGVMESIGR